MEDFAQFTDNPGQYLQSLMQLPPSREAAGRLAGSVAASCKDNRNAQTAALYLQTAARHLPAMTAAAAGGATNNNNNNNATKAELESEMKSTQIVYEVVEAVGHAVTQCQPRSLIAQSGILPVLGNLSSGPTLGQAHVEFLQACIFAGHYAYAERIVLTHWPRPNATVSVRNVLRYFYLRGVVHLGCQHLELAVRCFRTCLGIPSEVVSAIAVAAWKKLVLIQCLLQTALPVDKTKPMNLPSPTPSVIQRFINNAVESISQKAAPSTGTASAEDPSSSIVHLVDNLETGESSARERTRYASLGVSSYASIVQAFVDTDMTALQSQLEKHEQLLKQDGNWGLAQQVATELPCRQLYSWSHVYSSISLPELAQLLVLSVEDLSRLLLQVTLAKKWPIQVTDGHMVSFPRLEPVVGSTNAQDLVTLAKLVQKLDVNLSSSSKFLSLARKESSSGGSGDKGAPSGPRGVEDI